MVVKSTPEVQPSLDLGYLALFLGMRVNQLVMERMRAAGFRNVRESHGYVIQHLIEKERTITELAGRMEVTQQAASKAVAELASLRVVELAPSADRRAKTVKLSAYGWTLIQRTRRIRRQIDARLIRAAGAPKYETAKSILTVCLNALGGTERIRTRRILPAQ